MKSLFINNTRLNDDECDVESKDLQNNSVFEYNMLNVYQTNKDNEKECKINYDKIKEFQVNNRMNMRDGVGYTNACRVDNDSSARQVELTHDRDRQQLFSRVFQGGPNVNRGGFESVIDSKLTQGSVVIKKENTNILSEKSYDRFEPMNTCMLDNIQSHKNIVPEWKWGGEGTRDVLSQRDFLENNGYMFDGNVWLKSCK